MELSGLSALYLLATHLSLSFIKAASEMTILEMSSVLIEKTVEKLSVTSLLLAATLFTLTLAYLSKLMFRKQLEDHEVSAY